MPRDRIRAEITKIGPDEPFRFNCHPGVICFTDCCRSLELSLSPYDVIRLCSGLGISATEFLDRYAMVAVIPEEPLPQVMLAMDEKNADRCPFVSNAGCRVYPDRPAACRAYPLGRGISMNDGGGIAERYVVLNENHCRGFAEAREQTPRTWLADQGLEPYNRAADLIYRLRSEIMARERKLSGEEIQAYINSLYLDPEARCFPLDKKGGSNGGKDGLDLLKSRIKQVTEAMFGDD